MFYLSVLSDCGMDCGRLLSLLFDHEVRAITPRRTRYHLKKHRGAQATDRGYVDPGTYAPNPVVLSSLMSLRLRQGKIQPFPRTALLHIHI